MDDNQAFTTILLSLMAVMLLLVFGYWIYALGLTDRCNKMGGTLQRENVCVVPQ
jgi:hypothetical protein